MLMLYEIVSRILLAMILAGTLTQVALAQSDSGVHPYATMEREKVSFQGPGRGAESDIQGETINIGLVLPLKGPRAERGNLLLEAAQIAVDEANASRLMLGGPRFALTFQNESEQWGQASNAIVQLITQDQVVAIITSDDGRIAHQAEQIVNKLAAPVLTLASDPTTTRINIPWIFRVGPSDADQAHAMVADISRAGQTRKVLLIVESDYDGRIGGDEFTKAITSSGQPLPERIDIDLAKFPPANLMQQVEAAKPDVVVIWSGSELAERLVSSLRQSKPSLPLYLSQKSGGFLPMTERQQSVAPLVLAGANLPNNEFNELYRARNGMEPGLALQQICLAVRTVISATRSVGANRARMRDYLASGTSLAPGEGVKFDRAGNSINEISLTPLQLLLYASSNATSAAGPKDAK